MASKSLLMSMGTVSMWGFSPSFDLLESMPSSTKSGSDTLDSEPLSILLVGPGDIRHVLATIAHRRRHAANSRPLHIYVFEKAHEVLARHLLLLQLAQDWQLPLRQRCNLFLEVFGNARVQERTSAYIEEKARELIDLLHNERGVLADQLDFSHLKMRTRDDLIDAFRSWFQGVRFDVDKLRDHRLRHYYEVRYDYRNNLIDWDYTASALEANGSNSTLKLIFCRLILQMSLKKIENASVIHIRQFREWRNSGIAFEFGDQTYTEPNRTMASYTEAHKKRHGSVLCRGLWTDIVIGPYLSFGVRSDSPHKFAQQLFEIHNKGTGVEQNRHNTTEVAVFNVLSYLYELEKGEPYVMKKAHDVYSGIGESELDQGSEAKQSESRSTIVEVKDENDESLNQTAERDQLKVSAKEHDARQRAQTIFETFEGVKIIPLTGELEDMYAKKRYSRKFDHVFLSTQYSHTLLKTPDADDDAKPITNILADTATVSIESPVFLLPLKEAQRVLYVSKLLEMADAHSLRPTFTFANGTSNEPTSDDLVKLETAVLRFNFTRAQSMDAAKSTKA